MSFDPVLYIIVRTDMASMTRGRAAAQAAHASTAFTLFAEQYDWNKFYDENPYLNWKNSTPQGFGKTVIFGADETDMYRIYNKAKNIYEATELVIDTGYVVHDGDVLHSVQVVTSCYIFISWEDREFLRDIIRSISILKD